MTSPPNLDIVQRSDARNGPPPPERPPVIWYVTLYTGLLMGVANMLVNVAYLTGIMRAIRVVSVWERLGNIGLAICIAIFAVGTWRGNSAMRYGLALAVLVRLGITLSQPPPIIPGAPWEKNAGRVLGAYVIPALIVIYLLFNVFARKFFREMARYNAGLDTRNESP